MNLIIKILLLLNLEKININLIFQEGFAWIADNKLKKND